VSQGFDTRVNAIASAGSGILAGGLKGVEKESLRIDPQGWLARTPHPALLGSALTNRFITTDFSEALLEFITPAFGNTWEALRFLCDIHQFTYARLGDELLWTASMPCRIPDAGNIPLARYGTSNVGRMKTIYRRGLGYRYGRGMQTIAGVHFNYSLPTAFWSAYRDLVGDGRGENAFRSHHYLGLVRNFRRFGWIVLYLFGSSPAMCRSFGDSAGADMPLLDADTRYEPFGTSLRMSDLGYSNQNQARINISLNSLEEYVHDLGSAIRSVEPAYEKIGVKVNGEYRQLNASLLQIENEYYSPIRPKRVAHSGERPTAALERGGIEYVEIRSLDINVNDPAGINQNTMRFMEAFLVYCLLEDSPPIGDEELEESKANQTQTARRGRDPEFRLLRDGHPLALRAWAEEILDGVRAVAELIDAQSGGLDYAESVQLMQGMVADPESTPSAGLLRELRDANCSFFEFGLGAARGHRDYFASIAPLLGDREAELEAEVGASIERQAAIEAADTEGLDDYLRRYFGEP
jgi:glutamate--cysteine ligase